MLDWHDLDDNQLLQKAKEGEADAFGELYERHVNAVYRFLYARLDNRMDAEDFVGEVFIRAYHSLSTYNERGIPFLAYILLAFMFLVNVFGAILLAPALAAYLVKRDQPASKSATA